MVDNRLTITLDGQGVGARGISIDHFTATVKGFQDAVRLMVRHLAGSQKRARGRLPNWLQDQSSLRLTGVNRGSLVAELALEQPSDERCSADNLGSKALCNILSWDGAEDSNLPTAVTDKLFGISERLPDPIRVWYGIPSERRRVEIRRREYSMDASPGATEALLQGWLKEVNWDKHTAKLYRNGADSVRLRFKHVLYQEMQRLATQYVKVQGRGQFNKRGQWTSVSVDSIKGCREGAGPFNLEEFLEKSKPRVFDPERIVTASDPFEVDEFIRDIHEARDVGQKESTD